MIVVQKGAKDTDNSSIIMHAEDLRHLSLPLAHVSLPPMVLFWWSTHLHNYTHRTILNYTGAGHQDPVLWGTVAKILNVCKYIQCVAATLMFPFPILKNDLTVLLYVIGIHPTEWGKYSSVKKKLLIAVKSHTVAQLCSALLLYIVNSPTNHTRTVT